MLSDDPLWYKDAIIYELHVRAFCDSVGDGCGDFRGLTQKLDHLQDLGMGKARYRGRRKTRLQALLAATVANFKRLGVLGAFDVPAPVAIAA